MSTEFNRAWRRRQTQGEAIRKERRDMKQSVARKNRRKVKQTLYSMEDWDDYYHPDVDLNAWDVV